MAKVHYPRYFAGNGTPCTEEEEKLIDSFRRLAKKWEKNGCDLMIFSYANNGLYVVKKSCINDNDFYNGAVIMIDGITHDGGDPDCKF